ncbi:MAG: ribonuclease HII [Eubacteriales bacterium]
MDWHLYEDEARRQGYSIICGVDEAGRGPLAGPVFAAAVILPEGCEIEGINDSKKLSEKKRDALFDIIKGKAIAICIASASEAEIDNINILQTTFLQLKRAVESLCVQPDIALVDGIQVPPLSTSVRTIIQGDGVSASIAAASILAKVSRDRYMLEIDRQYPQYEFSKHKGYGTKLHYEMLAQYGISPVHRKSFLKNLNRVK